MTTVVQAAPGRVHVHARAEAAPLRIALLGLGNVGSAFARLAAREPRIASSVTITGALVRNPDRRRDTSVPLSFDGAELIADRPDVVVEALGGLEPARTLVLDALSRGIPVVTANKSLLAAHGGELLEAAAAAGVELRYEAAVIAGVPFLGTFARRPIARSITGFTGIVNGTTNFILSAMATGRVPFASALAEAQALGYAEPDPANDIQGIDAAEKLCVLLRHFGGWSVDRDAIERTGIDQLEPDDLEQARAFGGAIRPIVHADWEDGALSAFASAAFVPFAHPLAHIDGVLNACTVRTTYCGTLSFSGPGAGPTATAATILDDVFEIRDSPPAPREPRGGPAAAGRGAQAATAASPPSAWVVRLAAERLPNPSAIADLLSAFGVWIGQTSPRSSRSGVERQWILVHGCTPDRLTAALGAVRAASTCRTFALRALEVDRG